MPVCVGQSHCDASIEQQLHNNPVPCKQEWHGTILEPMGNSDHFSALRVPRESPKPQHNTPLAPETVGFRS